jgi:hypothetical protein
MENHQNSEQKFWPLLSGFFHRTAVKLPADKRPGRATEHFQRIQASVAFSPILFSPAAQRIS